MEIYELLSIVGILATMTFVVKTVFACRLKRDTRIALFMSAHLTIVQEIALVAAECETLSAQAERNVAAARCTGGDEPLTEALLELEQADEKWDALFERIVLQTAAEHRQVLPRKSSHRAFIEAQHLVWWYILERIEVVQDQHIALYAPLVHSEQTASC